MSAQHSPSPRPGRLDVRAGWRPGTDFGDDSRAPVTHMTYASADGHSWDALLAHPPAPSARSEVLVIAVHGSMGNYTSGVVRRVTLELARHGYPTLSVNTRMANFGVIYGGGRLDQAPEDLDGALALARELGYGRVALMGYGLGATMVAHHQALRRPADVEAVLTLAHPSSLPDALRERWRTHGAAPGYDAMLERAARRAGADDHGDDIVVVARGSGTRDVPADTEVWTERTWWASRAPQATHAVSRERVRHMTVPLALVQPASDVELGYGEELRAAASGAGVPVHLERVAGADHTLWDASPAAAAAGAAWLDRTLGTGGRPARRGAAPVHDLSGVRHRLVTIRCDDGTHHDALFHIDPAAADRRAMSRGRIAALHLHGNQGNFSVGALRFLGDPLARAGIPILSLETRLSNVSQIFGSAVFEEALADLAAGVEWLGAQGFDRVVVSGYSLGAVLATRFAADLAPPRLVALMTFGNAVGLPNSARRRMALTGARPTYDDLAAECRDALDAGRDRIVVARRAYAPSDAPRSAGVYTAGTWWHSRSPEAFDAMTDRHIGRVRAPILLVQGDQDEVVLVEEAGALAEVARAAGNRQVEVAIVPGVGHSFHGGEAEATGAALEWLARVA